MRKFIVLLILIASYTFASFGQATPSKLESGLDIGENCPAFDPTHVSGPDHGTKTCPMCAHGQDQGLLIWLNNDDFKSLTSMSEWLEGQSQKRGLRQLRVFIMYMNPTGLPTKEVERRLQAVADKATLRNVALTYVPNPTDRETSSRYRINPSLDVKNTVMVYKKRKVVEKETNFEPSTENMTKLVATLDRTGPSSQ
jgi:protocatechuate 3,4-dioxygenase beta subunit